MEIPKIKLERIELKNLLCLEEFKFDFTKESIILCNDTAERWYGQAKKVEIITSIFDTVFRICNWGLVVMDQGLLMAVDPEDESNLSLYFIDDSGKSFSISIDYLSEGSISSGFIKIGNEFIDLQMSIRYSGNPLLESVLFFLEHSMFLDKRFPGELFNREKENLEDIYKRMTYEYFPVDYRDDIKYDITTGNLSIGPFSVNDMGSGFKKMVELYPCLVFSKKYGLPVFLTDFDKGFHPNLTKRLLNWYAKDNNMGKIIGRFCGL